MDWVEHIACRTEQSKWTIQSALLDGAADCSYIRSATYATRKTYRRHQSEQGFLSLVSSQGKQTLPYPTSHTTSKDWQNIAKHFGDCAEQKQAPVKHKSSSALPNVKHSEAMWNNMKQCGAMWNNAMLRTVKQCEAMWSGVGQGWVCRVGSKGDQAAQMDRSKKVLPVCQPHHYTRTLNSNSQIYHFPSQNCAHFAPTLNSNFRICRFHIWAYHTYQLHPTNRLLQQKCEFVLPKSWGLRKKCVLFTPSIILLALNQIRMLAKRLDQATKKLKKKQENRQKGKYKMWGMLALIHGVKEQSFPASRDSLPQYATYSVPQYSTYSVANCGSRQFAGLERAHCSVLWGASFYDTTPEKYGK